MAEIRRRLVLVGPVLLGSVLAGGMAMRPGPGEPAMTAWDFSFPSIDEGTLDLAAFRGRVLLVTNTASFCGFTYQYEQLEKLHREFSARGLTVVGVPSQDFYQEKGSNAEVKQFCEATFGVEFPMAGISHVRGAQAHPFYAWVHARLGWEPTWNFNKVLIGRDGQVHGTFGSRDEPYGPKLQAALAAQFVVA
jgi:glutathione peroxidase